jgi:RHH-type transcriptional regulator, proline utilization regulon repressor / proline dehydrogenase / delta 1-pyrroline-5-carboxylate dehydrogenase
MAELDDLVPRALALARWWLDATAEGSAAGPARERRTAARLGALVADPAGLELAVRFVDRVARPRDLHVAARELSALGRAATGASFLGPVDQTMLTVGARMATLAPAIVVPAARARLRALVGHLVADAGPGLGPHLARMRAEGFRVNLNLLGEAVLGEREAATRLERITALVERDDVDYVSVKVSAVASQLSTWDTEGAAARVAERLLPLYRTAAEHGTFLNLDMEEYRDLALTMRVFSQLAVERDLLAAPMGIVLQAYLPDALAAYDELADLAAQRRVAGGALLKVRLVKGANLAMERVEAELHGWTQAPFETKAEVDAAYLRLVERALDPERAAVLRVGVASHNLFHVAAAHVLAGARGVSDAMDVEMLQGMAPAQARAVRDDVGSVLLYTPAVVRDDFDVAVAYLVRRLEENAAGENFLHALFAPHDGAPAADGRPDHRSPDDPMTAQETAFVDALARRHQVADAPRRDDQRHVAGLTFSNTLDTDPSVTDARCWAWGLVVRHVEAPAGAVQVTSVQEVDAVVARAVEVAPSWAARSPAERAAALRRAADALEAARGDLVAVMVAEASKTVAEADPEVSEAVDFARYYADRALDVIPGATFTPHGISVVTPPWNFPVAIPAGSALAALAAGSPVLLKPAPATPRCAQVAMAAIASALPPGVLTVVLSPEGDVGRRLVTHPDVARVILTGSIETARMFAGWRPDLDVLAETSGKNALVVTPSADVDLAVADVVRSAFGHAGQKCSAASLLILVGSAGTDDRLRRQLADAVTSLRVGPTTDFASAMGPLVEPAQGKLLRALTTLDDGEEWLVQPQRLDEDGTSWTPGVKHGVAPGSWFHATECFGPVLGVMRARTLDEAIEWQNAVSFGLTGGIHSLDEDEIATWLDRVEVGNAYVNRHITGAIVRRQPFGGWKASVVGPGAKAGGPHYVAQLGRWVDSSDVPTADDAWLAWATADDERAWAELFSREHDPSGLRSEANLLRYRPVPSLTLRVRAGAAARDVVRVEHAASTAGVPVELSRAAGAPGSAGIVEDDAAFTDRVRRGEVGGRVRVVGGSERGLRAAAAERVGEVTVLDGPVLASAERELLVVLREQAISRTRHRFGHVPPDDLLRPTRA